MVPIVVWFLLRAGVKPEQITKALADSVNRHHYTAALVVPRPQVLEYSRVITQWMTDALYLDDYGNTVTLPVTGTRMSFRSLVRKALPHA
jgi:hypothetical protein